MTEKNDRCIQLADVLETLADTIGDRPALIAGGVTQSFAELDERASRLANHLAAHGVGHGDHVAVHAENCAEWVETFYACFKIRAVPININFRYLAGELRYLYDNSDSVAVVIAPAYVDALDEVRDAFDDLRHVLVIGDDYEAAMSAASPERNFEPRSPDDIYIVYTGGTTGMPKGVEWRHEDLVLGALNAYRMGAPLDGGMDELADEVREKGPMALMMMAPMMHGGCQWAMGNVHMVGGAFVLYTEPGFDPEKALALASASSVNALCVIGDAMAKPLAERLLDADAPKHDLSSVFVVSNGAAPLTPAVRALLREALPGVMITDGYGSSETGTTGAGTGDDMSASPRFQVGPETTVFTDDFEIAGVGERGLLARSGRIPLGYYKDPDKTATTFPTVDGTRWVIPGDFARLEGDGTISLLGRGSGSINSGGEKIFPEEVEAVLMQHDSVADVAVVGTPHERWGQQVTALVQVEPGVDGDATELREFCKTLIAAYKAPKEIRFVDTVPRTPVGKLDYRAAKSLAGELLGVEV